ncbi:putative ribosome biogenesis protein C8F11.04 [Trichoderma asperellum]|uniref:Putative ribosome biogenesis protein C8F11.04 n=1 Tax=Trichoderma asperellum TaxID=101201 RepID=A0A6V8QXZ0_TRIAP|nr:ribosomal protein L1p/L10e family-domain-containing protein [Trichoderma asperelloides]GFP57574.1 putative ribosome biogenesis protein C8F11.04 [Trichoderma asperellum]
MAPSKKEVAKKEVAAVGSNAVAAIDAAQTLKASKALLSHIKTAAKEKAESSSKRNLLEEANDGETDQIVWLTLTTKRHISDKARLQPGKVLLPHSLNASPETTVCLITADPQRAYKNIVAADDFPAELRKKITRVIDVTKLKAKYGQYEAQRKLFAEHDVFLGDDRIINRLPKILGKTFYKTTLKRPVPVVLKPKARKVDGKRTKPQKKEGEVNAATPAEIAKEIEKALGSALVSLSPSTNTAVRVGFSDWTPEQIAANVEAVAGTVVEKWVPQQWRNVKSIYIKGAETAALPIWMTDELWLDEKDVIADSEGKASEKANIGKKRKNVEEQAEAAPAAKKAKKAAKEEKPKPDSNDDKLDQQISDRKTRLRSAKAKAAKASE